MVAHTFNPSTWKSYAFNTRTSEVETVKYMSEWKEEYKEGEDWSLEHSFGEFVETGSCLLLSEDSVKVKGLSSVCLLYCSVLLAFTPIFYY